MYSTVHHARKTSFPAVTRYTTGASANELSSIELSSITP